MNSNSNKTKTNNKSNNKNNTLNEKSEIIPFSPGEINVNLNSNTKCFEMYKEDLYNLYNKKNFGIYIAILKATKCGNNGHCYYNNDEDEVVHLKFDSSEKLFIKSLGKKSEYVPKAYILIIDENNFNKRSFEIKVNKKTIEEIEEELILNSSEFQENIEYIKKLKLNRSTKLKNMKLKEELKGYIIYTRKEAEENNRLLNYYLSSLEREMLR